MVYRLEAKKALRRARKVGNAHVFEALITRDAAKARLVDEFLSLFGGRMQPVMAQLIEAGNLTPKDVADAERLLKELSAKRKKDA
jgi:predicted transcriptional regulator